MFTRQLFIPRVLPENQSDEILVTESMSLSSENGHLVVVCIELDGTPANHCQQAEFARIANIIEIILKPSMMMNEARNS